MRKLAVLFCHSLGVATILTAPLAAAQIRSVQSPSPSPSSSRDQQDDEQPPVIPEQQQPTNRSTPLEANQVGRTASSSAGQVGQRQTRESAATQSGVELTGRVASRIQNRVQNRLRTRIDRTYDPQANANDPFLVAQDQVKTVNRPR